MQRSPSFPDLASIRRNSEPIIIYLGQVEEEKKAPEKEPIIIPRRKSTSNIKVLDFEKLAQERKENDR